MSDIAQHAGVSASTVSLVLNERHAAARISETTRQKVLSAAEEMGYRTNHGARAMRTGNTRMIGIVGGDIGMEQVGTMIAGALEEMETHDYTLKLLPTSQGTRGEPHEESHDTARDAVRRSSELRLQGAIALHLSAQTIEMFEVESKRYKYPLLLLDINASGGSLPSVISDDEQGISAAINHLIGLGHRRVALVSGAAQNKLVTLRESAFHAALRAHELSAPSHFLCNGDFSAREPSVRAARALLSLPAGERPTALLCMGDFIAMAALQVASELGLRVPQELSIVGFADFACAQFSNPPLTTVRQDFRAMGRQAACQILQMCADETKGSPAISHFSPLRVPTQLIVRGTCGPAP